MSKIPFGLTRSATKIQDENAFRRPISGQTVKRAADSQMSTLEKKQKVEVPSTNKTTKRSNSATSLRNAGFSEQAKLRALRPITETRMIRGSMPPISFTGSNLSSTSSKLTSTTSKLTSNASKLTSTTSKPTSTTDKPTSTVKTKRPAWDLKGRIQDMEEHFQKSQVQNASLLEQLAFNNQRIAALEADNSSLNRDVQIKVTQTAEASSQISELQKKLKDKTEECDKLLKENDSFELKLKHLNDNYVNLQNNFEQQTSALKNTITNLTCSKSVIQTQLDASESLVRNRNDEIVQLNKLVSEQNNTIQDLLKKVERLESKLLEEESTRRKLHNTIQELKGNIRVYCRMRPPLPEELKSGITLAHLVTPDRKMLEVIQMPDSNTKIEKKSEFSFDCVFPQSATQAEVFEEISQLVQSSIDGYNVCIFAYGQTGSGKTYTMEGPEKVMDFFSETNLSHLGMIPRSVEQIFKTLSELEPKGWTYKLEALFLEIYNERIQDLLSSDPQNGKCEIIKSAGKGNDCLLSNVTASPVTCSQEVYNLLRKARINRVVAATKCNAHSSRSHYVFQLKIYGENSVTSERCEGILNLVDLAGSERVKDSGSEGDRLTEAKAINKSLSNLGKVIMSLSNKEAHIPYRDSKLTHLLANSLGGNSKTLMFVNISPDNDNISETINSLRFATKVNQCNIGTAQKRVK